MNLISVEPKFDESQVRPFGIRVHLAERLLLPVDEQVVDLTSTEFISPTYTEISIPSSGFKLLPGQFVLGSTVEAFRLGLQLVGRLDGRSTLARLGLSIHCTASVIDNNHTEHKVIVLEIVNMGPFEIILPAFFPIGMLVVEIASSAVSLDDEQNQYTNQRTTLPPNLSFTPIPFDLR